MTTIYVFHAFIETTTGGGTQVFPFGYYYDRDTGGGGGGSAVIAALSQYCNVIIQ